MTRFLLQRSIGTGVVLVGVLVLTFLLPRLYPVDPCLAMLGEKATDAQLATCHTRHHLDRPLAVQFGRYVGGIVRGDLGTSMRTGRPVVEDLRQRVAATLELSLAALTITVLIGLPLGILAATTHQGTVDWLIRGVALIGGAVPVFLLGLLLKELGSGPLEGLPRLGRIDATIAVPPSRTGLYTLDSLLGGDMLALRSSLAHLVLPALTLGLSTSAVLIRIVRTTLLEVLPQPYVRAARARGLRERMVVLRHALPNALLPTLTLLGLTMGNLLTGTVLTEAIFAWPGLGSYAAAAARTNDLPALLGVTLLAGLVYPTTHLLIELLQRRVDPRMGDAA